MRRALLLSAAVVAGCAGAARLSRADLVGTTWREVCPAPEIATAYVRLDAAVLDHKLAILDAHFPSQATKGWYDAETFRGLARLRGVEAGARYAEAFHCTKLVW